MLLRVDVYENDDTTISQTLYACLASSSNPDRLLTLGRKKGDVLFPAHSSISREHLILSVTSNPETDEQREACQSEEHYHMCVLLQNVGKCGSYLIRPSNSTTETSTTTNDKQNDTDNDDTDDEEAIAATQRSAAVPGTKSSNDVPSLVKLSAASQHLLEEKHGNNVTATIERVQDNTVVLHELADPTGSVIVQLGMGISPTIRISRHSLCIYRSGSRQGAAAWNKHAHELGLIESKDCAAQQVNLLVTPQRAANPNQIAAWCRNIPIVSNDFLEQVLLQRKSPTNPLIPNPLPVAVLPKDDGSAFWNQPADPALLRNFVVVVVKSTELDGLVQAAGGTILAAQDKLKQLSDDPAEFVSWLCEQAAEGPTYGFYLHDPKNRTKVYKELTKTALPSLTTKELAKCITEQRIPRNEETGDPFGLLLGTTKSIPVADPREQHVTGGMAEESATSQKRLPIEEQPPKQRVEPYSELTLTEKVTELDHGLPSQKVRARHEEENNTRRKESTEHQHQERSSRKRRAEADEAQLTSTSQHEETSPPPKRSRPSSPPSSDDEDIPRGKRLKLLTANERGWFQAAPKSKKKRREFQRTTKEIAEVTGEEEIENTNITRKCSLIVAPTPRPPAPRSRRIAGPDFRTFRKNAVPRLLTNNVITLVSVLPKESEEQLEFEQQRKLLQEQQRRADALFGDAGASDSNGRRRRR